MDNSPPGSSVHGILQARILEGLPFTPPRESSQPKDLTQVPCIAGRFFIIWATRKAQTCTKKKVMITVWWPAAGLIHYSFLNPSETITSEKYAQQIDEIHWKICNVCSQYWSTERAQFFSLAKPNYTSCNQRFKSWVIWAVKCCLIFHIHLTSPQPTRTSSIISKTFCRENTFTGSRRLKMLSKSSLTPEAQDMLQE